MNMALCSLLLNHLQRSFKPGMMTAVAQQSVCVRMQSTTPGNIITDDMATALSKIGEKKAAKPTEEKKSLQAAKPTEEKKSFATLLRHSTFIEVGDVSIVPARLKGKIIQVQDGNLYVDFGGKFHFVCKTPEENQELYVRGRTIVADVRDFELSARFLGSLTDTTLLEADGEAVALLRRKPQNDVKKST